MLLPAVPAILPSPAEAVEQYPLVRYVPSRSEHLEQPDWEESDLPDHEIESWNACCEICRDDYTPPGLRSECSLSESPESLRKLPCEHAYHQVCIDLWLGLEETGSDSQNACPTCRRQVIDHSRTSESTELQMCINVYRGCSTAAISPDGRLIASNMDDAAIQIWDTVTGLSVLGPIEGHDGAVLYMSFSPDSNSIASISNDDVICIWDVKTGQLLVGPLEASPLSVNCVSFAPDGATIACSSADGWISLLDAATGHVKQGPIRGPGQALRSAVYAPDGTLLLLSSESPPCLWRCTIDSWEFTPLTIPRDHDWTAPQAISPDGTHIVASSRHTIRVLDVTTGTTMSGPFLGHDGSIDHVIFAPSGSTVVSCSQDNTIRIWNALPQPNSHHPRYISAQKRAQLALSAFGPFRSSLVFLLPACSLDRNGGNPVVQISLDGTTAISCSSDGTVQMWNTRRGGDNKTSHIDQSKFSDVSSVAISQDNAVIASGSPDGTVSLWDAMTGLPSTTPSLQGHQGYISSVAFSPDGQHVASGSTDATICLWGVEAARMAVGPLLGHRSTVRSVVFSPDGKFLASASSDNTIRIWDAITGRTAAPPFEGHDADVNCIAFSPDGLRLVSGGEDKTVRVWDTVTNREWAIFRGHREAVLSVRFSPDGMHVVSGSKDTTVRIWSLKSGRQAMASLREHSAGVSCITFSTDGTRLVTSDLEGDVCVWAVARLNNTPLIRSARRGSPLSVSFQDTQRTSDTLLLSAESPSISMQLDGHSDWVRALAVSSDSRFIASGSDDGTVRLWDAAGGRAIGDPLGWFPDSVRAITFSADSAFLAAASMHGFIRIWEMDTGHIVKELVRNPGMGVFSLAYSPSGLHLAAAAEQTLTIWDVTTGTVVMTPMQPLNGSEIFTVAFSPNGRYLVSGEDDGHVRMWDAENARQLLNLMVAHSSVYSVIFSHDSSRLISCSDDGTINMWNPATGEEAGPAFAQAARAIRSISLSPDGNYLVGGSDDGNLAIWDVSTGQFFVQPFQAHGDWATGVAFTPDGSRVVSCSDDRSVRMWTLRQRHPPSITSDVNEVQDVTQLTSANISTEHIAAPSLAVNDHSTTVPDSPPSTRDPGPPSSSSPVLLSPQFPTVQVDSFVGYGDTPDGVPDPIMSPTQPAPTQIPPSPNSSTTSPIFRAS